MAGKGTDKFAGVEWTPSPVTGSPLLAGTVGWVDCTIESVHPGGDHDVVLGRVVDLDLGASPAAAALLPRRLPLHRRPGRRRRGGAAVSGCAPCERRETPPRRPTASLFASRTVAEHVVRGVLGLVLAVAALALAGRSAAALLLLVPARPGLARLPDVLGPRAGRDPASSGRCGPAALSGV